MNTNDLKIGIIFMAVLVFASCKTVKTVTTSGLNGIDTDQLIKNIEKNTFEYKAIEIKKITCQYESSKEKTSFRVALKSVKDDFMILSVNKLAIQAAKVKLTPDSVTLINYADKYWITDTYNYIENIFQVGVSFNMLQSIISNNVFADRKNYRDFTTFIAPDSRHYILQANAKKENIIIRYFVDPDNYKISKIIFEDKVKKEQFTIKFSEFEKVGNQLYPSSVELDYNGQNNYLKVKLKLSGIEINKTIVENFVIPGKYSRLE